MSQDNDLLICELQHDLEQYKQGYWLGQRG